MKQRTPMSNTTKKLIFIGFTLIIVAVLLFIGSVKVQFGEDSISISATMASSSVISYNDIKGVLLDTDLDAGRRVFGIGSFRLQAGDFKNEKYGDYQLYAYAKADTYVIIQYSDGIVAFALEDSEATIAAYETLMEHIELAS
ncbi:MAG: PH domain-containing protein [Oscillospiraceae bacterium]|jgi:hypothetical protein